MKEGVRKSVLAGAWYPGRPEVLRSEIEGYLNRAAGVQAGVEGEVVGLISPHAGYMYSGQVAAYAYNLIRGKTFDSVIVIGPSHRVPFRGASVFDRGGYETPLGIVPVDVELAEQVIARGEHIAYIPGGHAQEHSVEIQIPFLQMTLGSFKFVPIVMGDQGREACDELAGAIVAAVQDKKVLVVGSSDLSHFHSYDRAVRMDSRVLEHLETMNVDRLLEDIETGSSEACGGGPMAVTMMTAKKMGADRAKLLKYANSGDVTGDRSGVVGYAAAAFFRSGSEAGETKKRKTVPADTDLTDEERAELLRTARETIEKRLLGDKTVPRETGSARLKEKRGAFVSLHKKGMLRGCIGCLEGRKPLMATIQEMAESAAFNDPRFAPLGRDEMKDLDIEISILSPLKEINDINEIDVGTHGLYIIRGFQSGLLLPQVATQYSWDRLTFLEETCRKAGLPAGAWKDKKSRIYIFSADVFGEK